MKKDKLNTKSKITSGFSTPENYFVDFSDKILSKLPQEESKIISLKADKKYWLFAAAAAVLILLSIPVFNLIQSNSAELDSATYEDHFVYHSEIDAYELINDLDGKDLDTLKSQLIVQDETLETILATSPSIEILLSE